MTADFVDTAVDGWAKEWPTLETSALQITARLDRVARLIERRATEALTDSGVNCRDLDVLGALRRVGAPFGLPASQLARVAMLTSGGMTGQADRLANAGLVVRRPDPQDRRAVVVTLTPEGNEVVERALKDYLEASEEVLQALDKDERLTLASLLRKLLVSLEGNVEPGDPLLAPEPPGEAASGSKGGNKARSVRRFEEASTPSGS